MKPTREVLGGMGNQMFKQAFLWCLFREGAIPDTYLQSPRFWLKYKDEIRTMFGGGIGRDERVAIHIRRGDYLKVSQFHVNLWDTDYYKEAIKLFPKDTKFLVFCKDNQSEAQDKDDREWCERNIPLLGIDFELHKHTTETEDMNAMASCRGLIGANSSFSFWAAFIGDQDKKVVFPKEERWFTDGGVRCELMTEWQQI